MRRPAPRGFGRVEAAAWRDCHLRRQRDSRRSVRGQLRDRPHPHEGGRRASELTRARRPRCREYRDPNDAGVWSAAGRVSETRPSHASHLPSCSRGCSTPTAPAWLRVSDRNSVAASPGAVHASAAPSWKQAPEKPRPDCCFLAAAVKIDGPERIGSASRSSGSRESALLWRFTVGTARGQRSIGVRERASRTRPSTEARSSRPRGARHR